MRIVTSIIFFIILISVCISSSFALGKAASMGNLQSIVPSGPFDAARNPALLPSQTSQNSTGLFCTYIMHFLPKNSDSSEQHLNQPAVPYNNSIDSDMKSEDPKIYGININAANSTKSGNFAIGFALTDNGNNQYQVTKEKITNHISGIDTANGTEIYRNSKEDTKTTEINPALVTSLGFRLSKVSTIGFQLITGFSKKIEDKEADIEDYIGPAGPAIIPTFKEKREKEINKISGELGFGYLYNNEDQQIGLLVRTGEFSWFEKKLKVRTDMILPSPGTQTASSDLKMNGKYTSGPGIVAGAYNRISSFFAIALETGVDLENSYKEKDLDLKKNPDYTIIEQDSIVKIGNIYTFKAGFELNLLNNFIFSFGSGYLTGSFNNYQNKDTADFERRFKAEMDIQYWISTAGIQYSISKNITFDIISAVIVYKRSLNILMREEDDATNYHSEIRSEQISKGMYLHTGIGVTLSF
jgi:hypothetical protein